MKIKIPLGGFTLIELIVVTTIIIILASSSTFYFFDFIGNQKVSQQLQIINSDLKDFDSSIENYENFDYKIIFQTGSLAYTSSYNTFDIEFLQSLNFNSLTGSGEISIVGGGAETWNLKVYKEHKLYWNQISDGTETYTDFFNEVADYNILGEYNNTILNTVGIQYFSEENIEGDESKYLILTEINTEEDKTGTGYSQLEITNIGGKKEIDGGSTDKIYLFFEQGGYEGNILITK